MRVGRRQFLTRTAAAAAFLTARRVAAAPEAVTVAAAGDCIITRRIRNVADPDFLALAAVFQHADAGFANCEMTFHDLAGYPAPTGACGDLNLVADPAVVGDLAWAGLNLMTAANNHGGDYGPEGLLQTLEQLERAGITAAGAGANLAQARAPRFRSTPAWPHRARRLRVDDARRHGGESGALGNSRAVRASILFACRRCTDCRANGSPRCATRRRRSNARAAGAAAHRNRASSVPRRHVPRSAGADGDFGSVARRRRGHRRRGAARASRGRRGARHHPRARERPDARISRRRSCSRSRAHASTPAPMRFSATGRTSSAESRSTTAGRSSTASEISTSRQRRSGRSPKRSTRIAASRALRRRISSRR